jgi:hypothetical protein
MAKKTQPKPLPRGYLTSLNDLVDTIYAEATKQDMTWHELAEQANLAPWTVYRLGNRITKKPRFDTVWKLARAVKMVVQLQAVRSAYKKSKVASG